MDMIYLKNNNIMNYIRMARPDYWIKQVFLIPGMVLAFSLVPEVSANFLANSIRALISVCLAASANYVINEWFDRGSDLYHPFKSSRPAAQSAVSGRFVLIEYIFLVAVSIAVGWWISIPFTVSVGLLLIAGWMYNIPPVRFKDLPYFDILSEAVNNSIRLLLGWLIVSSNSIPPVSMFLVFWFGGAFLMGMKRYAEYRTIVTHFDKESAGRYRKSFRYYDEKKILSFSLCMALMSAFGVGMFIVKYRPELMLMFPFSAWLFMHYYRMSLEVESIAQSPEKLHKDKLLVFILLVNAVAFFVLMSVDFPWVEAIVNSEIPSF
tara:strand:+ start:11560 stop:12522 length:963 start_codon:yes stop_codon:yes gene_type:complete